MIEHLKRKHPIDIESEFEPKSKQLKMDSFASNKMLAPLARKYLSIVATCTPAERVFSVAGLTVSHLRTSLTPEHVDMLVFFKAKSW